MNKKQNKTSNEKRMGAKKVSQISISLPTSLIAQLDKMAAAENRNRSNFIANTIAQMAHEFDKADHESLPKRWEMRYEMPGTNNKKWK